MAKQRTKLKSFFDGKRRRCRLDNFLVLKDRQDVLRMKLSVSMPLSNEPAAGMEDEFTGPYLLMVTDKSTLNSSKPSVAVEGAHVSIFATDAGKSPTVVTSGAQLQNFHLVGDGIEDKRTVALEFVAYLPLVAPLKEWCFPALHKDFYLEVVPSQLEIVAPEKPPRQVKAKPQQGALIN